MVPVKVTKEVSLERLADLLCCAFEGGTNYWCAISFGDSKRPTDIAPEIEKEWGEFRHCSWPLSPGGSLCLMDEMDGDNVYYLDLAAVEVGLQVMADKYPHHFANFIDENEDAETGDVFLQCCLFRVIRYG